MIDETGAVEHTIDESKYTVEACQEIAHGDVHEGVVTTFHGTEHDDPDLSFYNELYQYLSSGTFPAGSTETYKKNIRKRATNYMINSDGTLSYGFKNPKSVLANKSDQYRVISLNHIDQGTGKNIHYLFWEFCTEKYFNIKIT